MNKNFGYLLVMVALIVFFGITMMVVGAVGVERLTYKGKVVRWYNQRFLRLVATVFAVIFGIVLHPALFYAIKEATADVASGAGHHVSSFFTAMALSAAIGFAFIRFYLMKLAGVGDSAKVGALYGKELTRTDRNKDPYEKEEVVDFEGL